jgi:hypothetical protein
MDMDASTRDQKRKTNKNPLVLTVRPRKLETMELGIYPSEDAIPEFSFDYLPDVPDAMGAHIMKTESSKGIRVIAQFQSYANETVMVFGRKLVGSR